MVNSFWCMLTLAFDSIEINNIIKKERKQEKNSGI